MGVSLYAHGRATAPPEVRRKDHQQRPDRHDLGGRPSSGLQAGLRQAALTGWLQCLRGLDCGEVRKEVRLWTDSRGRTPALTFPGVICVIAEISGVRLWD